jgi:RNA polymerase sigma-70 factor (ECF subfamily)
MESGDGALDGILRRYYEPLVVHLGFKFGINEDAARDLIQGFVARKILGQTLLAVADRRRGRFRTFLLNALDTYVIDEFRSRNGPTRRPNGGWVRLDENDEVMAVSADRAPDPFDAAWALKVIEQSEIQTRRFYEAKGRQDTWGVFLDGVLTPLKNGSPRPGDEELARTHGFESARQASNAITTAKRQFGKILREVIREYADTEAKVEAEIRELMAILAGLS